MAIYVVNIGEKEALKDLLVSQAMIVGLYKNNVNVDGNTTFEHLEELDKEADGYQPKKLTNDVVFDQATANKWYVYTNSDGKAEAQYSNAALEWVASQSDVDNNNTVYGVFAWTLVLPFTSGGTDEIKVGSTITGITSGATAEVTAIRLTSGSWSGGDAAGELCIKNQTGTFQAEGIKIDTDDCATIAGDSEERLLFVEAFTTGQEINQVGFTIKYTLKLTMSTA